MAITDKDIKKLSEVFATKKEIERFATKDDLAKFATKEDLAGFATKDDLAGLKKEIMDSQDKIIKELESARQDRTLAIGKDREQDRRLDSLEGRVARVEERVGV